MQKTGTERDQTARDDVPGSSAQSGLNVLNHAFKVIAFDWDGTAVANRRADATAVRAVIERLLDLGVYVVVVTGTNFGTSTTSLSSADPRPAQTPALRSAPTVVPKSTVSPTTRAPWSSGAGLLAQTRNGYSRASPTPCRDEVAGRRTGLQVAVVYDRLNRRKVDVIPDPEWADPPKSRIGDLLRGGRAPAGERWSPGWLAARPSA